MWVSAMHLTPVIRLKEISHPFCSSLLPDFPWTVWVCLFFFFCNFSVQSFFFFSFTCSVVGAQELFKQFLFSAASPAKFNFVPPCPSLPLLPFQGIHRAQGVSKVYLQAVCVQCRCGKGLSREITAYIGMTEIDIYICVYIFMLRKMCAFRYSNTC